MERKLSVLEHLEELRQRAIISLAALGVATVFSVPFSRHILKILKMPANGAIDKLAYFGPEEAFVIYMRIGFLSGFIFAFPIIAYQLWNFLAPAINDKFKGSALRFTVSVFMAFFSGCAFAFFIMLPSALKFLLGIGQSDLVPVISATKYISFVTSIILVSGLVFQMPVLSYFLTKVGILNASILRRRLGIAIVAIAVFAAIITPTGDAFNMLILAGPMVILYILSIWISWLVGLFNKDKGFYGKT